MMKFKPQITIIAVGKVREPSFLKAIEMYQKKIRSYADLEIIEVEDVSIPERSTHGEEERIKELEGERILERVPRGVPVVLLDLSGKQVTSDEFSEVMIKPGLEGRLGPVFIIGGSLGVSQKVRERSTARLAFSRMTFPHQLMRVILLEQIYRGLSMQS